MTAAVEHPLAPIVRQVLAGNLANPAGRWWSTWELQIELRAWKPGRELRRCLELMAAAGELERRVRETAVASEYRLKPPPPVETQGVLL